MSLEDSLEIAFEKFKLKYASLYFMGYSWPGRDWLSFQQSSLWKRKIDTNIISNELDYFKSLILFPRWVEPRACFDQPQAGKSTVSTWPKNKKVK
jgi:hypothetical protein